MEKDTIITLDDNSMYALLDETIIENKKYFFAVKIDKESNNPTDEYEIFECEEENGETYMNLLDDEDFKQSILLDFTNNFLNNIENEEA